MTATSPSQPRKHPVVSRVVDFENGGDVCCGVAVPGRAAAVGAGGVDGPAGLLVTSTGYTPWAQKGKGRGRRRGKRIPPGFPEGSVVWRLLSPQLSHCRKKVRGSGGSGASERTPVRLEDWVMAATPTRGGGGLRLRARRGGG